MTVPRGAGRWRTAMMVASGAGVLFATPMMVHYSLEKPMISADKALKQEAIRRGAFNNSGSRDCGPE